MLILTYRCVVRYLHIYIKAKTRQAEERTANANWTSPVQHAYGTNSSARCSLLVGLGLLDAWLGGLLLSAGEADKGDAHCHEHSGSGHEGLITGVANVLGLYIPVCG